MQGSARKDVVFGQRGCILSPYQGQNGNPGSLPIDVKPNGSLSKYLKNPLSLLTAFSLDTPLLKTPLKSLRGGLKLKKSVDLLDQGAAKAELKLKASVEQSVGLRLFKAGDTVFDDHFGGPAVLRGSAAKDLSPLKVAQGKAVLAFDLRPEVQAGVEGKAGPLSFGAAKSKTLTFANYREFDVTDTTPSVGKAISETVKEFVIPSKLADLKKIAGGTTVTVDSAGELKFEGGLSFSGAPKPFASLDVPRLPDPIEVKVGAKVGVSGKFRLFSKYQLRIWRDERSHKIRLGYYKMKGRETTVTVTAEAALKVGTGDRSATVELLRLAGGKKAVNEKQLTDAGLPAARIKEIAKVVESGMSRKVEASLAASFRRLKKGSAAFLFEIDLEALDSAGKQAVRRALRKDISGLGDGDRVKSPNGVKVLRSIFRDVSEEERSVRINLFGIFNYISVSKLLQDSQIVNTPGGEFAIVDKVTSTQTKANLNNLKKGDKALRHLMDEAMLVTAIYRGARHAVGAPDLDSSYTYFELHRKTGRQRMKDNLDVAAALGLITKPKQRELLGEEKNFGVSTFYIERTFNDSEFRSMFVSAGAGNNGKTRTASQFDKAGLRALGALYAGDENNEDRWRVMNKNWLALKTAPALGAVEAVGKRKGLSETQSTLMGVEVSKIITWREAMVDLAKVLRTAEPFFQPGGKDPDEEEFKKLQVSLRKKVGEVAKAARAQWGDPWGIVAFHFLAGGKGFKKVKVTGDKLELGVSKERAA